MSCKVSALWCRVGRIRAHTGMGSWERSPTGKVVPDTKYQTSKKSEQFPWDAPST